MPAFPFAERSYSLSNLAGTRRNGLRFVKAVKSDEEWTRESRAGIGSLNKPKTSRETAEENTRWYRDLVSGSSGNKTREASLSVTAETIIETQVSVASTSKVSLEHLAVAQSPRGGMHGAGSKEQPFTLADDGEEQDVAYETQNEDTATAELEVSRHQRQITEPPDATVNSRPNVTSEGNTHNNEHSQDVKEGETSQAGDSEGHSQDMYCLLCKTEVPAADVAGHRTSILHQISRSSHKDDKALVPPTHYGVRSSNIGYGMLQRLGWTEDTGLGSSQEGRKAPLKASDKHDRKGLGVDSKRRLEHEETEGKIVKRTKQVPQAAAKPLAKNRKELERAKKKEMQMFKEGLAYLNT